MIIYKVKGKMIKHKLFSAHPRLSRYLPETYWLTAPTAFHMLNAYTIIFLKPDGGSGGTGIVKIRKLSHGYYRIYDGRKRHDAGAATLYSFLISLQGSNKPYIVQRGIRLARYGGRIFDVRTYLQKPRRKWMLSGMVARVAVDNRYVTNAHQGGQARSVKRVLSSLFNRNKSKVIRYMRRMRRISKTMAGVLDQRFKDTNELGIDLGIERNGRVWIIEANTRPQHRLFTRLSDKSMLRRIRRNKRLIRLKRGSGR